MPDAVGELCKLAGVERPEEIGLNGPVVGARVSDANVGEDALRLFEVVFGRDSLTVALLVADLFPRLLEATVLHLADYQGRRFDARSEEEPGRIAHEIRDPSTPGPWKFPYYGAVDATPLFVIACARAIQHRPAFASEIREAMDAAVEWLLRRLAADDLGLLSFQRANPEGIENQVWKDSWDSMSHSDGSVCNHGAQVASVEAQALAYDALLDAGRHNEAQRLRLAVDRWFWVEDAEGGFYALGVDRDPASGVPRRLETRASNMGWLLRSRLLDGPELAERRQRIVDLLVSDEFLVDGGIRTLSSREVRFRPRAYHNGNAWGFDTYLCSLGLGRHGFTDEAQELQRRLLAACHATHRFPEFVAGGEPGSELIAKRIVDVYDSVDDRVNRVEQPPQEIQAWTVASVVAIEHASP
jgi:glycogen debranching enzyme